MGVSAQKIKAMIIYFANFTDPELLGKVKLMKLFYFADFSHVKKYGSPITYDDYINMEHGPIPSIILNLINSVENDLDHALLSDTISIETKEGQYLKRIIPKRKFTKKDEKYFTTSELEILKEVISRFSDKNTRFIEEKSHKESAWQNTKELEKIPYTLAAQDPDSLVDEEEILFTIKVMNG